MDQAIATVAKYSPLLVFDENEPMKQTLAQAAPIKQRPASEVESVRQGLMLALGSRDEMNRQLPQMDYSYLIYHLTVLRLERLRLAARFEDYDYGFVFLVFLKKKTLFNNFLFRKCSF